MLSNLFRIEFDSIYKRQKGQDGSPDYYQHWGKTYQFNKRELALIRKGIEPSSHEEEFEQYKKEQKKLNKRN